MRITISRTWRGSKKGNIRRMMGNKKQKGKCKRKKGAMEVMGSSSRS